MADPEVTVFSPFSLSVIVPVLEGKVEAERLGDRGVLLRSSGT